MKTEHFESNKRTLSRTGRDGTVSTWRPGSQERVHGRALGADGETSGS